MRLQPLARAITICHSEANRNAERECGICPVIPSRSTTIAYVNRKKGFRGNAKAQLEQFGRNRAI